MQRKKPKALYNFIDDVKRKPGNHCLKIKQLTKAVENLLKDESVYYDEKSVDEIFDLITSFKAYQDAAETAAGENLYLLPWEEFFIACLYGLKRTVDGSAIRRSYFTKAYLQVAKKNGKTTLIAALALINLITVQGAEVIVVNASYKLAAKTFDTMKGFISQNEVLQQAVDSGEIKINDYNLSILYYPMSSKIITLTNGIKADTQGFNPSFIIFDEAALYSSNEIITKLESGRNRKDAYSVIITTAEKNKSNPAFDEYTRSQNILSGKFPMNSYLPMVFELDQEDLENWDDERLWIKANPSIGPVRGTEDIRNGLTEAIQNGQGEAGFKAYFLNVWSTEATHGIQDKHWSAVHDNAIKYEKYITPDKLASYPVVGALDLALVDDFTAYTLYFYIKEIDCYYAKHHFYIPAKQVKVKMKRDSEYIEPWIKDEYITATIGPDGGEKTNYEYIVTDIVKDKGLYPNLRIIVSDPVYLSRVTDKFEPGYLKKNDLSIIKFEQKWGKLGFATSEWYGAVLSGRIIDDNPVMRWMVGNASYKFDNNKNMHFEKVDYAQSTKRIDGIDTSIMAYIILKESFHVEPVKYDVNFLKTFSLTN